MVAFPDHRNKAPRGMMRKAAPCAASWLGRMFAGAGCCLAAPGLWMLPAVDPTSQLVKLCVSVLLLGVGMILMSRRPAAQPEAEVHGLGTARLRVREYDARGRAIVPGR